MENLKDKIAEDQKNALKDGDALRLSTLRMLSAAVANKEIELRKKDVGLSDQEILDVISSEAKKRKFRRRCCRKRRRLLLSRTFILRRPCIIW